jgi:hypothetical protein
LIFCHGAFDMFNLTLTPYFTYMADVAIVAWHYRKMQAEN